MENYNGISDSSKRIMLPESEEHLHTPTSQSAWIYQFKEIKRSVKPARNRYMPFFPSDQYDDPEKTLYTYYCDFINDILGNIRDHEVDYCFYIYQIEDLLKHEPCLKSQWLENERCFKVWI